MVENHPGLGRRTRAKFTMSRTRRRQAAVRDIRHCVTLHNIGGCAADFSP